MKAQAHSATVAESAIEALLRLPTVRQLTGVGRSTIYKLIAEDKFPKPVRIGERAVAWRESEVSRWNQARPRCH